MAKFPGLGAGSGASRSLWHGQWGHLFFLEFIPQGSASDPPSTPPPGGLSCCLTPSLPLEKQDCCGLWRLSTHCRQLALGTACLVFRRDRKAHGFMEMEGNMTHAREPQFTCTLKLSKNLLGDTCCTAGFPTQRRSMSVSKELADHRFHFTNLIPVQNRSKLTPQSPSETKHPA